MLLLECLLDLIRFLLGAALFSFMNVVAWRLPQGMDPLQGRSHCPQCGHTLGAPDLVPVFSWLLLRGRCRHCGARIPVRYFLVEVLGGVLALGCTRRFGTALSLTQGLFGMSWAALTALAVCGILLSVALIDAETQLIPDRLNLALAVCGVLGTLLSPAGWLSHLIGAVCVSVPMLLLCLAIDGAFGGGDIKLMAACSSAGRTRCWRCFWVFWAAAFTASGCWPPKRPTRRTTLPSARFYVRASSLPCSSASRSCNGTARFCKSAAPA